MLRTLSKAKKIRLAVVVGLVAAGGVVALA
ncbi:MAG: hypothetical protein QOF40_1900, partial [Actinomycetota bacterium]|nr:hypothetical protein [Actinomycetota bacterium]